jgi:protein-L-isoaspartate(D-aspartate) O-methyltransferase
MVALSPEVFAAARTHMVDSQLRPNKVTDKRLLEICGSLPRESFFPAELGSRAYVDENVRLGKSRVALAPMGLIRMIQALEILEGDNVLVVGAGNGYGAAVLAKLGATVTALESDETLARIARAGLSAHAPAVALVSGTLAQGWAASAPYDAILVEGAAEFVPEALVAQLAPNGRIVLVRHENMRMGAAAIGARSGGGVSFVPKFDCSAPLLPGLAREAAFVF